MAYESLRESGFSALVGTCTLFSSNDITEHNRDTLATYYDRFKQYVTPKANNLFAIYRLNNHNQGESSFDHFVTGLELLVKDCVYDKT